MPTPDTEDTGHRILDTAVDLFRRACEEMQPGIEAALQGDTGLEARLHEPIQVKLNYFAPNHAVFGALVRNGGDPKRSLSPFSQGIMKGCGFRIPRDLEPALPGVLWLRPLRKLALQVIEIGKGGVRGPA
jgi:hypothetical protein